MADSPETAVALSDDDLDDLVGAAEGTTADVTEDPDDDPPAPAGDADEADEEPDAESLSESDEDEIDASGTQPAEDAAPPSTIPAGAKPFQFKASGALHTLPGALELPDGSIVVPKDTQTDLRQRLASEAELRVNFKNLQRDSQRSLAAAKTERTGKDIESDAVIALFSDIKKMTPDERWEYFERFDQEIPKLELDIQRKQLEQDRKALAEQRNPSLTPEEQQEQRTTALTSELATTYQRVMASPAIKALSVEQVNAVFAKHAKRLDRLVVKGEQGEVFDDADVIEDLNLLLQMKQQLGSTTSAKAQNALRNADANPIPPVVATRAPVGEAKKKGDRSYRGNQRGFRDAFLRGDLDS